MPTVKLTERAVTKLKAPDPSSRQVLHWDTALKGFGVLCSATSDVKTYVVKGSIGGRVVRRKIGRVNVLALNEARLRAREMLAGFLGGIDPQAETASSITLRDALEAYLKARQDNLKPRSLESYRVETERHLGSWLDLPLKSITREMVDARHQSIAEEVQQHHRRAAAEAARRHLARAERVEQQWPEAAARHRAKFEAASKREAYSGHATANRTMRGLRAVWNFMAERVSDLPPNPVKLRRQWHPVCLRERVLRGDDLPAFYKAVAALANPVARDYILLMLFTGLRRREAASLRWSDVDLQGRVIRIAAANTKARRKLDLPMSDVVHDLLVARRSVGKTEFVFPSNAASRHVESAKFFFNQIAEASNIRVSAHDLRRTFITVAESCDISPFALRALVNHSLGNDVTSGYIQMSAQRLVEPAQRVADALKKMCGVKERAGKNVAKLKGKR